MPGDDGTREPVVLLGPHPKCAAAGPVTSAASVTRPVTTTSAPASRQAAIPNPEVGMRGQGIRIPSAEIVPLDMRDAHGNPEPTGQLPYGVGESGGVQPRRW